MVSMVSIVFRFDVKQRFLSCNETSKSYHQYFYGLRDVNISQDKRTFILFYPLILFLERMSEGVTPHWQEAAGVQTDTRVRVTSRRL